MLPPCIATAWAVRTCLRVSWRYSLINREYSLLSAGNQTADGIGGHLYRYTLMQFHRRVGRGFLGHDLEVVQRRGAERIAGGRADDAEGLSLPHGAAELTGVGQVDCAVLL